MSTNPAQIQAMLNNHLQSFFRKDVAGIMQDYTEQSVFITPSGTLRGLTEIQEFFTAFIDSLPATFFESFKMNKQEFVGDAAYIAWESAPLISLGTDTFLVQNDKIALQTFAAYPSYPSA